MEAYLVAGGAGLLVVVSVFVILYLVCNNNKKSP
jgi:hypothetical protein